MLTINKEQPWIYACYKLLNSQTWRFEFLQNSQFIKLRGIVSQGSNRTIKKLGPYHGLLYFLNGLSPWKIFSIWSQINRELCVVMSKVLNLGLNYTIQLSKTGTIHQDGSLILETVLCTKSSEQWEPKLNHLSLKTVDDFCNSVQNLKKCTYHSNKCQPKWPNTTVG